MIGIGSLRPGRQPKKSISGDHCPFNIQSPQDRLRQCGFLHSSRIFNMLKIPLRRQRIRKR